jgi:hypothetical protein
MRFGLVLCAFAVSAALVHASPVDDPGIEPSSIGTKTINVIVINFDPVLKTRDNQRLHEYMKWSDPWMLTEKMIEDAKVASHGYVDYRVVDRIEHDGFTTFRDGFTYTEEHFLDMWENDRDKANPGMTSFDWLFEEFGLRDRIRDEDVGEIWLWGAPYMAWDELHWKTPGDKIPYQTDNPWFYRPYDIPDVGKTVWVMGWNYERGEDCMLESYCHRIESVLSVTVGKGVWDHEKNPDNDWVRFTRTDRDFPGQAEVGSVHCAPNSEGDYDWNNSREVATYCDDWLTYPDLPRKSQVLNAESGGWGPGGTEHHMWWMTHLPHAPGSTDGFHNNWWEYIVNYDEAVERLPPPGATFKKARTAMYAH